MLDYADRRDVDLGFEPEPDMLIDTTRQLRRTARPHRFAATEAHARRRPPPLPRRDADPRRDPPLGKRIANVHIEDMRLASTII